jgi:hypothetical protein
LPCRSTFTKEDILDFFSLDKLVLQFEKTKPEFYAGFKKHRIIVDPTGPVTRRPDAGTPAAS